MRSITSSTLAIAALATLSGCGGGDTVEVANTTAAPVAAASAPAGQNWVETVTKTEEGYRMGNPDAPIQLVEYGARSCPTCGQLARDAMTPLSEKYVATGKVAFEFRDFLVHGAPDMAAALVGSCGGAQPFFPLLEQMYGIQNDYLDRLQKLSPADQQRLNSLPAGQVPLALAEAMGLVEFAKQRGLPEAKVRACLTDQAAIDGYAKAYEKAATEGTVTGTPTLILNGRKLENTVTWEQLEVALKAAGA